MPALPNLGGQEQQMGQPPVEPGAEGPALIEQAGDIAAHVVSGTVAGVTERLKGGAFGDLARTVVGATHEIPGRDGIIHNSALERGVHHVVERLSGGAWGKLASEYSPAKVSSRH